MKDVNMNLLVTSSNILKIPFFLLWCFSSFLGNAKENFGVNTLACPELQVDISTVCLKHCAENEYFINYCNNGTMLTEGAIVQVELDSFFSVSSTSLPIANQTGNIYSFVVGDLDVDDCGSFQITAFLDCAAAIGQTHCIEALIFPDSLCVAPDPSWDESLIEVDFECDGDSIFFQILNAGDGDMDVPGQFYIIIDDLIVFLDDYQLQSGESTTVGVPTDGGTFYFHASQPPGYPEENFPSVTVENCQLGNSFSTGFFPQYPENDYNPSVEINCQQSVENCVYNSKIAYPEGWTDEHIINANQELEYQINFQNTTNATLSDLVICDTLSPFLDPATVQAGAASHAYEVEILSGNVLKFTFAGINLPDSLSNLEESFGFVKFTIGQLPDNAPGTVIYNDATIIFGSDSMQTNETFHTIPEPLLTNIIIDECEEYDYFGMTVTSDTIISDTVDFSLFTSILTTEINIHEPQIIPFDAVICEGEIFELAGELFFETGFYQIEVENPNGCIDIYELFLEVIPYEEIILTEEICEGEVFEYNGEVYDATGIYTQLETSPSGCLNLIVIDLTVNPVFEDFVLGETCSGLPFFFEGEAYFEEGIYEIIYLTQNGCDSTIFLELFVTPPLTISFTESICEGESFTINNISYTQTGNYFDLSVNNQGCEEIIDLELTVFPSPDTTFLQETLCEGQTYSIGNQVFANTGNYHINLATSNGCDSIINLDLFVETNEITCFANSGNDTLVCANTAPLFATPMGGEWAVVGDTTQEDLVTFVWMNNTITEVAVLEYGEYRFAYTATSFDSSFVFDPITEECIWRMDTCIAVDTITITFDFLPENFAIETTADCWNDASGAVLFSPENVVEKYTFSLDNQDFISTDFFENLETDSYALYLKSENNCFSELNFMIDEIAPLPPVNLEEEYQICSPQQGVTINLNLNDYDFPLAINWSNESDTTWSYYNQTGEQFVSIETACETQTIDFAVIDEFLETELLMPNAFSPNEDGQNDFFGPVYQPDPRFLSMHVYSRWGTRVFSTNNFSQLWDGTYNGNPSAADVYIWVLEAELQNCLGELTRYELKGDVTLIR